MRFPQLIATVRDPMNSLKIEQAFVRSPVTVGRAQDNALRLDSRIVSRHHGAFFFDQSGLHYADVGSANGTFVDGRRGEAGSTIEVGPSTVVTIGPFQVTVELRLVALPRFPSDPAARTSIELAPSEAGSKRSMPSVDIDERLHDAVHARGPIEALRRALQVTDVVANLLVASCPPGHEGVAPMEAGADAGPILRYLMELDWNQDRVEELRAALAWRLCGEPRVSRRKLEITPKDGEA